MVQQKLDVTPKEYFQLFHDHYVTLLGWGMVTQDDDNQSVTMLLQFKNSEGFTQPLKNTIAVLAAFMTTHARLRLYTYLEKLQDRVLYFDTGKITFTFSWQFLYCCMILVLCSQCNKSHLLFRFGVLHI